MVKNPLEFRTGEIRVEKQTGLFSNPGLQPFCFEFFTKFCCSAILPDNGIVDRLTGMPVPDYRGLPLVGDTNANDICSACAVLL